MGRSLEPPSVTFGSMFVPLFAVLLADWLAADWGVGATAGSFLASFVAASVVAQFSGRVVPRAVGS